MLVQEEPPLLHMCFVQLATKSNVCLALRLAPAHICSRPTMPYFVEVLPGGAPYEQDWLMLGDQGLGLLPHILSCEILVLPHLIGGAEIEGESR